MTDRGAGGQSRVMSPAAALASPGQPADFETLFQENYAFVWRSLLHFGLPEALADDAAQEVFLIVYRRLEAFDRKRSFRSWVYGIARHVASSTRRGEQRAARRAEAVHEEATDGATPPGPGEQLETKRRVQAVEAALGRMPADQREVFVLSEIEGFAVPEIAQTLGVKLNTVYSRLRLARGRFERDMAALEAGAVVRGEEAARRWTTS